MVWSIIKNLRSGKINVDTCQEEEQPSSSPWREDEVLFSQLYLSLTFAHIQSTLAKCSETKLLSLQKSRMQWQCGYW